MFVFSHSSSNSPDLNESLTNHLFLPCYLPSSADADYLLQQNNQNEYKILEYMTELFQTLDAKYILPVFSIVNKLIQRWLLVQNPNHRSAANFQSIINELSSGDYLPFYFNAQNAAILIEIDGDQPLVSSWQVALPTETITSSVEPHLSCFPVPKFQLLNRTQLTSQTHCELLVDFMSNTIEYSQSKKASLSFDEPREVPISHYVCDWWIMHLQGTEIQTETVQFTKKHRDHIRMNNALLPFRRSGLWMTIKVVLQTILTKHLKTNGIIVYKLLITYFLTDFISKRQISTDLLMHCLRKIVRRINKIEDLISSVESNDVDQWIKNVNEEIKQKIKQILPKSDWYKSIQINEQQMIKSSIIPSNLNPVEICRHSFDQLKQYLNRSISTEQYKQNSAVYSSQINVSDENRLPSLSTEIGLISIEIWTELCLEKWINSSFRSGSEHQGFEDLLSFFEDYQRQALDHYRSENNSSDSIGYSRFILTALTIIQLMHKRLCEEERFERLKLHRIEILHLFELFEYLVLPKRTDMIRARHLFDYFYDFNQKSLPDLLQNITSSTSFGVHFATNSIAMNESLNQIRTQAVSDKHNKTDEINAEKQIYEERMKEAHELKCECDFKVSHIKCDRCEKINKANAMKVSIYECPIPLNEEHALAVIFELQMPKEIRCFRDIIWLFSNRLNLQSTDEMNEWLRVPSHANKLNPFYNGSHRNKVKLVSPTRAISQSHYSIPRLVSSTPIEGFVFENSLQVEITPTNSNTFDDECRILTPQLTHPNYKDLQFSMKTTEFVQNKVIAQQSICPIGLNLQEFIEFGSFRSGHCLQWWNLLSSLELNSLSLHEESVCILLSHSLFQYGPITIDRTQLIHSWCPQSHHQLFDDCFVDELICRLDSHLNECQSNWQNELVLVVLTIISIRIFAICNSTRENKVSCLILKCRNLGENWIKLISENIQNTSSNSVSAVDKLREKIVTIGIACLLTFSASEDRIDLLLSTNEQIISLLQTATVIQDNLILNKKNMKMGVFMQNLFRFSQQILVTINPVLSELVRRNSYKSLNEFCGIYCAAMESLSTINGKWKKRNEDIYDGWFDGEFESNTMSINLIKGTFLVNEIAVGYLPEQITSNNLFTRVFGNHVFEVQSARQQGSSITKHGYHKDRTVRYQFKFDNRNQSLIIEEKHSHSTDRFQLIPPDCFENKLPEIFISNYSHWINLNKQQIEFRPVSFQDENFLTEKHFILTIDNGFITTNNTEKKQILINQSSTIFQKLFQRYFSRLDDQPYVYMLRDAENVDVFITIHLSRLGIAFKYDSRSRTITSREYSEMHVDEDQWLGTLTGLKSGLLLSNFKQKHFICRKLIVPFGEIKASRTSNNSHQIATIKRDSSTPFLHQYFVFSLNDRLRILQSTDSPTGWLYLALLHAMTSHPLPDEYTGMTGIERAFQLLNSAGCWSDQPYDKLSRNILNQIAIISPTVDYYSQHRTSMEQIEWNGEGLPYSMQHFGYYLIVKNLIDTSERLNFMHSSSLNKSIEKQNNEKLLGKLYWDYRDSSNPIVRLPQKIEEEIKRTSLRNVYQPTREISSQQTNYSFIRLVDSLYSSGDVDLKDSSNLQCFPLSRWISSEYELKNIWIGLLKLALKINKDHDQNKIEQFELSLDFLHYIAQKCSIQPFHLQMLKTVVKTLNFSLRSVSFPEFIEYENIDEVSFESERIRLPRNVRGYNEDLALSEIRRCYVKESVYENDDLPHKNINTRKINQLMESWRSNKTLRSFLPVQKQICSVAMLPLNSRINVRAQQFSIESFQNHSEINVRSNDESIDEELLESAKEKFENRHSNYFLNPTESTPIVNEQKPFPAEIFPSIDSFSEITRYFQKQLNQSWNDFQSAEEYRKTFPSIEEIDKFLDNSRQQSTKFWNELTKSLIQSNEILYQIGLLIRILPTNLISMFQQTSMDEFLLTNDQRTLLGGLIVNWIVEQQIERALNFAQLGKNEDFEKELSNIPHANWKPSDHIPWLILQLEMNFTIREIQIEVARHMTQPKNVEQSSTVQNIVMQMNMGEGKTSVILPMLAVSLCSSSSSLVRIIVLKSLFKMNYQSLKYKLGGLLNRRVMRFACCRDMNFNNNEMNQIFDCLNEGLKNCDVVLTSPEDILSFDLLTIDKCRRKEWDVGRSMLNVQRWLKNYSRDVLDESDEILHVKYQLIYSVGGQQQVDGGAERWETIQSILNLVKRHASDIAQLFTEDVFYKPAQGRSHFPQIRLITVRPFRDFCIRIANDWFDEQQFRQAERALILSFILDTNLSVDCLIDKFPHSKIQFFLILRGLLSSEVLFIALKKRYRVNFGVNPNTAFNRLMAVPFRAKDVAADNTEFGHPDVAIILTQLSYYYSGLSDSQLMQCFENLTHNERDPDVIYDQWISQENEHIIVPSIKQWKGVNLKDYEQRTRHLFPIFRWNMLVINYFLNTFVFPREAKQFPSKLVSSAWDLSASSRSKIITGFSGTNDTQLLLPVHICQYDLPELRKTDAIVLNNLLQIENEYYQPLPIGANSDEILQKIVDSKPILQVIIDVGAVFIDGTNREIAVKWLNLSEKSQIDYAVYFESNSIFVCDRQNHHHAFLTSPASERLDRCVIYLDEIHTRGTDFKFSDGFRAALTLGNGLTKDRLVQAAMRMRKLGKHHWLTFWSSFEVHQQIRTLKKNSLDVKDTVTLIDILRWVYENTQQTTWDGFNHWATQSLSYQRKLNAFRNIHWDDNRQMFTDVLMEELAQQCLEAEVIELKRMYGASKSLQTISEIYLTRYEHSRISLPNEMHQNVYERLRNYEGSKRILAQLLDEEQQRELEQELEEERQIQRPPAVYPCHPELREEIKSLCEEMGPMLPLSELTSVFRPLDYAFTGTTFHRDCQLDSWQQNLWISTEFQRAIQTTGESLNSFLRPPRWLLVYRNQHLIFLSPFEANWVINRLNFLYQTKQSTKTTTTLRLLLPRTKREQSVIANTPTLTIPPSFVSIPIEYLVKLFIFNGTLYFENIDEQIEYCQCLGVCPKPRTTVEDDEFENGWIAVDGFVESLEHRQHLKIDRCTFRSSPLEFVRKLLEIRNNGHPSPLSHVGSIIFNAIKLLPHPGGQNLKNALKRGFNDTSSLESVEIPFKRRSNE